MIRGFISLFLFCITPAFAQPKVAAQANPSANKPIPVLEPMADASISLESQLSLRDPFHQPLLKAELGATEAMKIPELERYDVNQIKLIGMISGLKKNKALLTTPDGKMHIVTESEHVGTRHGVIKKISPNGVSIEEKVVNLLGQEEKMQTVLQFKEKPKEGL